MSTSNIRWVPPRHHDDRYYTKPQADALLDEKATKVDGAQNGNIAALDAEGDLADSGMSLDDEAGYGDVQKLWSASKTTEEVESCKDLVAHQADLPGSLLVFESSPSANASLRVLPALRISEDGTLQGRRYPQSSRPLLKSEGTVELDLLTGNLDGTAPGTIDDVEGQAWLAPDASPDRFGFPLATGIKRLAVIEHHSETGVFRPVYGSMQPGESYMYDHAVAGGTYLSNGSNNCQYKRRKTSKKLCNHRTSPNAPGDIYADYVTGINLRIKKETEGLDSLYMKFYVVGADGSGLPDMSDVRGHTTNYTYAASYGTNNVEITDSISFTETSAIAADEEFYIVVEFSYAGYSSYNTVDQRGAVYSGTDNLHTEESTDHLYNCYYNGSEWSSWSTGSSTDSWDIEFHNTTSETAVFPEPVDGWEVAAYLGSSYDNRELDGDAIASQKFVERPLNELLANISDGTAFSDELGSDEIPFAVVDLGVSQKADKEHTHEAADIDDLAFTISAHEDVAANSAIRHTSGTDAKLDEGGDDEVSATELRAHLDDDGIHRDIDDAATGETDLWSAQKITAQLSEKHDLRPSWLEKSVSDDQSVLTVAECDGACLRVDTASGNVTLYLPSVGADEDAMEMLVISKGANSLTMSQRQHTGLSVAGVGTDWITFMQSELTASQGDFAEGSVTAFSDDTDPSPASISTSGLQASDVNGETSATTKDHWKVTVSASWTHAPDVGATFSILEADTIGGSATKVLAQNEAATLKYHDDSKTWEILSS